MSDNNINIIHVDSLDDERVALFSKLTDAQLRSKVDEENAVIIVESPKVIKVALDRGYQPLALLCEERHIEGDARQIVCQLNGVDIFTGTREVLSELTGYKLTRGVLCAMRRPTPKMAINIVGGMRRIAVLDNVVDTTNIGAIFRSAAALGLDAILLTKTCCDPFNRRSIRVSMGSVFLLPWTWIDRVEDVKSLGFKTVAMALRNDTITITDSVLKEEGRLAIVLGSEGDGLSQSIIDTSDYCVKIPMSHDVDSLNVAMAATIAFWELI